MLTIWEYLGNVCEAVGCKVEWSRKETQLGLYASIILVTNACPTSTSSTPLLVVSIWVSSLPIAERPLTATIDS